MSFIDKFKLTKRQNIFLAKKLLVNNIYNSAKLEGLNVTFPETETILRGVNVGSVPIDEIECILNLRNAWKYLFKTLDEPFNLDYVCKINDYVSRNESLEWGKLRMGNVGISGTSYKPPIPIKQRVSQDIDNILKLNSVTEQGIYYFLYGIRNQLFWDGNKRTSTICANKILISGGVGILTIDEDNLLEFNKFLQKFYNDGIYETIADYLYETCIKGIEFERDLSEEQREEFER